jgi:hypothetical protein
MPQSVIVFVLSDIWLTRNLCPGSPFRLCSTMKSWPVRDVAHKLKYFPIAQKCYPFSCCSNIKNIFDQVNVQYWNRPYLLIWKQNVAFIIHINFYLPKKVADSLPKQV